MYNVLFFIIYQYQQCFVFELSSLKFYITNVGTHFCVGVFDFTCLSIRLQNAADLPSLFRKKNNELRLASVQK